jgi:hypothetical protein
MRGLWCSRELELGSGGSREAGEKGRSSSVRRQFDRHEGSHFIGGTGDCASGDSAVSGSDRAVDGTDEGNKDIGVDHNGEFLDKGRIAEGRLRGCSVALVGERGDEIVRSGGVRVVSGCESFLVRVSGSSDQKMLAHVGEMSKERRAKCGRQVLWRK